MFDLGKNFDLNKKFALPDTLLKSKNYCSLITCTSVEMTCYWLILVEIAGKVQ